MSITQRAWAEDAYQDLLRVEGEQRVAGQRSPGLAVRVVEVQEGGL